MSTGTGVNVSKANIYATPEKPGGLNVSKGLVESAIVGSVEGIHTSKANAYSAFYSSVFGVHVSKANVYSALKRGITPVQIVGGFFQDNQGNPLANGYLEFQLSSPAVVGTSTFLLCDNYTITIPLDSGGSVVTSPAYYLWANTDLTPSDTFFSLKGYTTKGQLVYGPEYGQIADDGSGIYDLDNFPN